MKSSQQKKSKKFTFFITPSKTNIFCIKFFRFRGNQTPQILDKVLAQIWLILCHICKKALCFNIQSDVGTIRHATNQICLPFPIKTDSPLGKRKDLTFGREKARMKISCGCSTMAVQQLPKLNTRVRFSSPAPTNRPHQGAFFVGSGKR